MVIGKVDSAENSPQAVKSSPPNMTGLNISEGEGNDAVWGMVTKLQNEFDASQAEVRQLRTKLDEQSRIKEMNTLLTGTDEEVNKARTEIVADRDRAMDECRAWKIKY
eukprot:CAMPEP_0118944018 /NCGR_PEP_ID=MMETSP1169-20130426/39498_1 /TAXON_ID=36882 /ORGANISM="Pyramimonas obovata, Strain CCMP722" /LENGTH=107 /DNA_ID=CAMNT_0006889411 /DNA_START=48 /DNA_END=368 /DNA_ORIENTATION=+